MSSALFWILLLVISIFILWFYVKKVKHLKLGSFVLITGGVKSGKTLLGLQIARKKYNKALLQYKFKKFLFPKRFKDLEKPLLYSNVPLNCDYVEITTDLLQRKERFAYKSVIFISEASIVADSQLIRDKDVNNSMLLMNKLIAHETKGGCIIYETQSIEDLHYSIKRCISNYLYISSNITIPFFHLLDIRELVFDNVGNVMNTFNEDVEESTKKYLVSKRLHKFYDRYALSIQTDHLKVNDNVIHNKNGNLKQKNIISFRKEFRDLSVGGNNEKRNN